MTPEQAYDILRALVDNADTSAAAYEALDVLWTSPCQLSHEEHYQRGWHDGNNHAYTAALRDWQQ